MSTTTGSRASWSVTALACAAVALALAIAPAPPAAATPALPGPDSATVPIGAAIGSPAVAPVVPVAGSATPLTPCAGPAVPPLAAARATAATEPPTYYAVELVPTRRVPGTRRSTGTARVTFERSPFGVSVAPDGSYSYDLDVRVEGLRPRDDGDYVVWVTRSDLSEIRRVGVLDDAGHIEGSVAWNKFLVVVTLEAAGAPADAATWEGPIVLRGMSRSGRMHTMAGHGPFQAEPCVKYGYE